MGCWRAAADAAEITQVYYLISCEYDAYKIIGNNITRNKLTIIRKTNCIFRRTLKKKKKNVLLKTTKNYVNLRSVKKKIPLLLYKT